MDKRAILLYQELSSNAWPAKTYIFFNDWILRLSEGVTKRANSVYPLQYTGKDLLKDIKTVEKIYKKKDLPVIFQLPDYFEPKNLQDTLFSLGYKSIDESLVMTAHIEDICAVTNREYTYSTEDKSSDNWFQALARFSGYNSKVLEGHKNIMKRIPFSKVFCSARENNEIVGIGLGVIEREYMGIFELSVDFDYRRKGIGQSIVAKLVSWARANCAIHVYLQVQGDNVGAISLYRKINLKERYRYRYLIF